MGKRALTVSEDGIQLPEGPDVSPPIGPAGESSCHHPGNRKNDTMHP